jgi:peptidyl-prolyl cis-trans isomerase SurA
LVLLKWPIGADLGIDAARTGFAEEMIFMSNRLFRLIGLAALVVVPAHGQNLFALDHAVAITTYLQVITEDDVDQRTKLDLLLTQKQVSREDAINEVSKDLFGIARGERAGLLSDDLVDKAFADMCSRRGVPPSDLMKTLEEKGIRLDTLRKRLRADVARERLARMQCRRSCEDRLDYPLIPKK